MLKLSVVEETVIMDTGVDPVRRKKKKQIAFASKKSRGCLMPRITGTQHGESFCSST